MMLRTFLVAVAMVSVHGQTNGTNATNGTNGTNDTTPTITPTSTPTSTPTGGPTGAPTWPTFAPTPVPTQWPTMEPTNFPTTEPTNTPTLSPTLSSAMLRECEDGLHNGNETDRDCGGHCPTKCRFSKMCDSDADCNSESCGWDGTCQAASWCFDRFQNEDETAIDCGGSGCPACYNLQACEVDDDCLQENTQVENRLFHCYGKLCVDECRYHVKLAIGDYNEANPGECSGKYDGSTGVPKFFNETLDNPVPQATLSGAYRAKFNVAPTPSVCDAPTCKPALQKAKIACEHFFTPDPQIAGLQEWSDLLDEIRDKCSVASHHSTSAASRSVPAAVVALLVAVALF